MDAWLARESFFDRGLAPGQRLRDAAHRRRHVDIGLQSGVPHARHQQQDPHPWRRPRADCGLDTVSRLCSNIQVWQPAASIGGLTGRERVRGAGAFLS